MAKSTKQIQEEITSKIVESLKAGTIPWRKPWSTSPNCGAPTNVVSGKAYRGINPLLLELHRQEHGFYCKHYATWKQWSDLGARVTSRPASVTPGEWGCSIIYYAPIKKTKEDPTTGEEVEIESSTPNRSNCRTTCGISSMSSRKRRATNSLISHRLRSPSLRLRPIFGTAVTVASIVLPRITSKWCRSIASGARRSFTRRLCTNWLTGQRNDVTGPVTTPKASFVLRSQRRSCAASFRFLRAMT